MEKDCLVIGKKPVQEAIKGRRRVNEIFLSKDLNKKFRDFISKWAGQEEIDLHEVSSDKLEQLVGATEHQGVAAVTEPFIYSTLSEVVDKYLAKGEKDVVDPSLTLLALDHLTDPQNFGAILRTADAAGVNGVIIPNRRSVDITPAVVKASSGASEHVPVIKVSNIRQEVRKLKEQWVWVIGTDVQGDRSIYQENLNMPLIVVVGNESSGISSAMKKECDLLVNIPMNGAMNSLNASVATALVLYEVYRQKTE